MRLIEIYVSFVYTNFTAEILKLYLWNEVGLY